MDNPSILLCCIPARVESEPGGLDRDVSALNPSMALSNRAFREAKANKSVLRRFLCTDASRRVCVCVHILNQCAASSCKGGSLMQHSHGQSHYQFSSPILAGLRRQRSCRNQTSSRRHFPNGRRKRGYWTVLRRTSRTRASVTGRRAGLPTRPTAHAEDARKVSWEFESGSRRTLPACDT